VIKEIKFKKTNVEAEFINCDEIYYASAYISFELRPDGADLSRAQVEELTDLFFCLGASIDKFALVYDGNKFIKLIIPIDRIAQSLLETGYALAEFKQAIEVNNLLEIEAVDTSIENYDENLAYVYMS
jgi:hypothetical protein